MNKPDFSVASDYAVLHTRCATFYYGYEVAIGGDEDNEGEWCFEAKFNGETITIPFSKLGCIDQFDVVDCLMCGIGWILAKYNLTLNT